MKTCCDCGKQLSSKKSTYCRKCYLSNHNAAKRPEIIEKQRRNAIRRCLFVGKNNPNYKTGAYVGKKYCIDCGEELVRFNAMRCKGCTNKLLRSGKNSFFYIDGRTDLHVMIKHLEEYKNWRNSVFSRDNYTCQECEKHGGLLEAHHVESFSSILLKFLRTYNQFSPIEDKETLVRLAIAYEPFWDISNGQTLCKDCHSGITKDKESNRLLKEIVK